MFSTGQWIFMGFFILVFVGVMLYAYRKDLKLHQKHYKGSFLVFVGFIFFIFLLFLLKNVLDF